MLWVSQDTGSQVTQLVEAAELPSEVWQRLISVGPDICRLLALQGQVVLALQLVMQLVSTAGAGGSGVGSCWALSMCAASWFH